MREITSYRPSVLGLQEVQATSLGWGDVSRSDNHAAWFRDQLAHEGYDGCFRANVHDRRVQAESKKWPRIGMQQQCSCCAILLGHTGATQPRGLLTRYRHPCLLLLCCAGIALFWDTSVWEPLPNGVRRINYSTALWSVCKDSKVARGSLCLWQGAVVALLRHRVTGDVCAFATTHISCRWQEPYVQIMQTHALMLEVQALLVSENLASVPVVLTGDYNIQPDGGCYTYVTTGELEASHPHLQCNGIPGKAECAASKESVGVGSGTLGAPFTLPYPSPRHHLKLRSAYATALGAEPPFTNYAIRHSHVFSGTLDYIFHTPATLTVESVLDTIPMDVAASEAALPNRRFPSDHLPLYAEFTFRRPSPAAALIARLDPDSASSGCGASTSASE